MPEISHCEALRTSLMVGRHATILAKQPAHARPADGFGQLQPQDVRLGRADVRRIRAT